MANSKKTDDVKTYEAGTRYAVTLNRVVLHDGFSFNSSEESLVLDGSLLNEFPDAVVDAEKLPPLPPLPEPPTQTRVVEDGHGRVTVVDPA